MEEVQHHFQTSKDDLQRCCKEVVELEERLIEKEAQVHAISKEVLSQQEVLLFKKSMPTVASSPKSHSIGIGS